MLEVEIHIPVPTSPDILPRLVEQACVVEGLVSSLKGTLAQYPNCVHWHFKKGREPGTLEITWWAKENQLWFKVASGQIGRAHV